MKSENEIVSMRLPKEQLKRLGRLFNYIGLGNNDTATVKACLNLTENVLQALFTENLIDAVKIVKDNNKSIKRLSDDVKKIMRNTKFE